MLQAKLLAEQIIRELQELRVELRLLRQAIGREKTTAGGE